MGISNAFVLLFHGARSSFQSLFINLFKNLLVLRVQGCSLLLHLFLSLLLVVHYSFVPLFHPSPFLTPLVLLGPCIGFISFSKFIFHSLPHVRLVFWNSIHLEVTSSPFSFLINSSWLLVFVLCVFFLFQGGFNLYCWKGIHFSWNNFLIFIFILFFGLIFSFHFWFRDLLRELDKKYEVLLIIFFLVFFLFLVSEGLLFVSFFWASFHSLSSLTLGICPVEGFYLPDPCELTFANTLLLSNAAVSLGGAFVSLEISSQFLIFFSLFSFILAWTFISLQIKEFRIMGLSINDSVYSSLFFFLTGLHFFHLLVGLLFCCLLFCSCSFSEKKIIFINLRISEVHLFYNLQLFYWHFLEILWLFIFLVFYKS